MIHEYLRGRVLPEAAGRQAVRVVRGRLMEGRVPVFDDTLRAQIDAVAVQQPVDANIPTPLRWVVAAEAAEA